MSIQAVAWVLDHSESRGFARLVLIALANHTNADGICWPAQRTIAREAGISKTAALNAVRELVALGEVEVLEPGDNRRSARYSLPFCGPQKTSAVTAEKTAEVTPGVTRTIKNRHEPSANENWRPEKPTPPPDMKALKAKIAKRPPA